MGIQIGRMHNLSIGGSAGRWSSYWNTRFFSGLLFEILSDTSLKITWVNNGILTLVDEICIERSTDGVTFTEIDTVAKTETSFTENTISISSEYVYRLRYRRNTHYSPYSNEIEVFSTAQLFDSTASAITDSETKNIYIAA